MIGDSKNDILAAKNAGIKSIAVNYGYNYGEDISIYKPDIIINDFKKLLELV
jgi:phosphoglycolate phosphatase